MIHSDIEFVRDAWFDTHEIVARLIVEADLLVPVERRLDYWDQHVLVIPPRHATVADNCDYIVRETG